MENVPEFDSNTPATPLEHPEFAPNAPAFPLTGRQRERAFREQIRMGAPELAAQTSYGGEQPAVSLPPESPKTGTFLDRDEQGNLVAREMLIPNDDDRIGSKKRMIEAAKAAFGEEPYGISPENLKKYPYLGVLQPFAGMADVALRDVNAILGGGAGLIAGAAEEMGMSRVQADKLQRDLNMLVQVGAVNVPKPTPRMMTRPVVRTAETAAPSVERIEFMTGKSIPKPIEAVPEKLPEITTPEGIRARLEQLADVAEAEPRAIPRPESGARLIPATTPYEMRSPRASVGAAANPEAGPLANILPETKEQLIRIFEPELQNKYMLEQKLGEMSSHHMLGEFSPSTLNELNTLNSLGGQARNEVINSVTHRSTEFGDRARALLDREMGTAENIRAINKAEAEARDLASTPLFEQFRSTIIPLDEEGKIQKLLPRLKEAGAIQKANRKMGISGEAAEQRFGDTAIPTAQAFQYAKEALDDLIGKSIREGERGDSRLYTKLKKDLLDAIDNHPDPNVRGVWEKARKAFSIPSEIIEARMAGENALSSKLHWSELKEIYDGYSPEAQAAYRQGLRASLEDILEGKGSQTRINTNLRNTLLAPANLRKISTVYGNEVAENIANGFRHEESMASNAKSIMYRSPTADLKAAQKNWLPSETMPEKAEKLSELAHAPVKSVVKHGFEKIKKSAIEAEAAKANRVREEAARILTLQGAEKEEALAQIYRMILERRQPSGAGTFEIGIPGINRATGGSVLDKMRSVRHREEGGSAGDGPFDDKAIAELPSNVPGTVSPETAKSVLKSFVPEFIQHYQASPDYDPRAPLPEAGKVPRNQPLTLSQMAVPAAMEGLGWWMPGGKAAMAAAPAIGKAAGIAAKAAPAAEEAAIKAATIPNSITEAVDLVKKQAEELGLTLRGQNQSGLSGSQYLTFGNASGGGFDLSKKARSEFVAKFGVPAPTKAFGTFDVRVSDHAGYGGITTPQVTLRTDLGGDTTKLQEMVDFLNRNDRSGAAVEGGVLGAMKTAREAAENPLWMHQDLPIPEEELTRVSTRLPTAVKSTEDPLQIPRLRVETPAMESTPQVYEHNVNLLNTYPGFTAQGSVSDINNSFKDHVKQNLKWLYEQVVPEIRERSKLWYDGGRKITDDLVSQYQRYSTAVHPNSSAAVIAVLSPQKDWFQNVSLSERVHDIFYTKKDFTWSPEMEGISNTIYGKPAYQEALNNIRNKKFKDLDDPIEKAMWLRAYDEAHNTKDFYVISPEGKRMGIMKNEDGTPSKVAWGPNSDIAKAIQALEANGDIKRISPLLGEQHKVRNFYNNIIAPNSKSGDVTIDTHAVAAALLRPLSGNSMEVLHNFGSAPMLDKWQKFRSNRPDLNLPVLFPGSKSTATTGMKGTYGIYADAYRELANELGILPRELQSITWEAVRSLYPETFKTYTNSAAIDNVWKKYAQGKMPRQSVYDEILKLTGAENGIPHPEWASATR